MRRLFVAGLAVLAVLVMAAGQAEARRGGGGHGGYHGGGGRGWGRVGIGVGLGVGAALAYRGWYGGYPSYAYPYGPTPAPIYYGPAFDGPAYADPLLAEPAPGSVPPAPAVAAPPGAARPAPTEARQCRAAIQGIQVSCRLTQATPLGGGCGCPSNMGMLAGQAGP